MTPDQQTQLQELRDLKAVFEFEYKDDILNFESKYLEELCIHALPLIESLASENAAKDVEIERLKLLLGLAPDPDPMDEENRCEECQNITCICGDEDEEEDTWGLEYIDTL